MAKSATNETQAISRREKPPVVSAIRWPDDVHRWLTIKARDERSSIQALVVGWARKAMERSAR
jgi:hypothetical protein